MNLNQARERVDELKRQIEHYNFCYYVLDKPEISDGQFDQIFRELQNLEQKFPELSTPDSPTQKVAGAPSTEFGEVKHRVPMMSLANAMSFEELDKWQERIVKGLDLDPKHADSLAYVCELKIDGLSIGLTYKKGKFVDGATRGNGEVGEDVTLNLKTIADLPQSLSATKDFPIPDMLEVRGEVYMPVSGFAALNKQLEETGDATFANPRNAAAGSLRQKNPRVTAKRKLSLWTYFAYVTDKTLKEPQSHEESLEMLAAYGLPVNKNRKRVKGIDGVKEFCRYWHERRHQLDYQTDGVVVKLDDRRLWNQLGATSHSPRWAVAFKYPPEEADTVIEEISYEVGRTGAVTPVANLKPVQLAGTTVKRASLHNYDQIKRLDVREGDTIVVRKAGDIIPEIISVRLNKRPTTAVEVIYPTKCPVCHTKLVKTEGEVVIRCPNGFACPAQRRRRIEHFVSRDAMDIEGMGESLVEQLLESELIGDPADLYYLNEKKLSSVESMLTKEGAVKKNVLTVLTNIEASKTRPFASFVYSLGIPHVGASVAELLAERFISIDELTSATVEDLAQTEGIGQKIGEAIVHYFAQDASRNLIKRLKAAGVKMEGNASERQKLSNRLEGQTFVITGTLSDDRDTIERLIKINGGKTASSVSKKTSFVLVGANPGSKLARAEELGITVIDEAAFKDMLSD
ncbi:MAG: NAD-dependent DNA ligase LigA [Candidatus Obscuribacterales bacterium]|nr:NAD-dependent DNA ligase LigA [Candidatus Obscuribacterales bacterium]